MPSTEQVGRATADQPTSDPAIPDADELVEHLNAHHADTVLFLVRHAAARPDADGAEIAEIGRAGVEIDVIAGADRSRTRLAFPAVVSVLGDIHDQLVAILAATRDRVGDLEPITSLERELATNREIPTHVTHVADFIDRSPNLREVVLEGGLDRFVSSGRDQFVYLMVRRDARSEVPADHSIAAQAAAAPGTGPIAAYYTVRSWNSVSGRITLWIVRHDHRGSVGDWAGRCEIGERVALWGPRSGAVPRTGTTSYLFVVDESGLGAVAALLDELPPKATAHVIVETVDAEHVVDLPQHSGATVTWLYRGDEAPGTGERLLRAVRSLDLATGRRAGLFAFGAGEARQMAAIRRHLRHDMGMAASDVSMTGYWRRR